MTARDLQGQLEALLADVREQVDPLIADAREQWQAATKDDLRLRLGGAFAGGLILGKVVRRLGR